MGLVRQTLLEAGQGAGSPLPMTKPGLKVIRLAVVLYVRYPRSHRDVAASMWMKDPW